MIPSTHTEVTRSTGAAGFAAWALSRFLDDHREIDGFDLDDALEKYGLIVSVPYNPAKHGEDADVDAGEPIFIPTAVGRALLKRAKAALSGVTDPETSASAAEQKP